MLPRHHQPSAVDVLDQPRKIRISWIQVPLAENRVIDVPDSAHSDHEFEGDFRGVRIRRITRSIENTRAARINMEKDGLCRPVSSLDNWDLLVWRRWAYSACVRLQACLARRNTCPKARMNSSELPSFPSFSQDRSRVVSDHLKTYFSEPLPSVSELPFAA